jgi:hypothetical protein
MADSYVMRPLPASVKALPRPRLASMTRAASIGPAAASNFPSTSVHVDFTQRAA